MSKEEFVAYLLQLLWRGYRFTLEADEEAALILRLLAALEEVERSAYQEGMRRAREKVWTN